MSVTTGQGWGGGTASFGAVSGAPFSTGGWGGGHVQGGGVRGSGSQPAAAFPAQGPAAWGAGSGQAAMGPSFRFGQAAAAAAPGRAAPPGWSAVADATLAAAAGAPSQAQRQASWPGGAGYGAPQWAGSAAPGLEERSFGKVGGDGEPAGGQGIWAGEFEEGRIPEVPPGATA